MTTFRRMIPFVTALVLLAALPAAAQATAAPAAAGRTTPGADRLFLSFFEDATLVRSQWWEGQLEYADYDDFETTLLRVVAAFSPWENIELGGRVGFGQSDSDQFLDGSGATDLDLYWKYYFGNRGGNTEFAAGALGTVPTGDDAAGLGFDAFSVGAFGSARHRLKGAILTANAGVRMNGDARFVGVDLDGKTSPFAGLGYIRPLSDEVSFVGEVRFESERFDNGDADLRVLGGINLRAFNRGMLRGAVGVGLDDGAPDLLFIVGYAQNF